MMMAKTIKRVVHFLSTKKDKNAKQHNSARLMPLMTKRVVAKAERGIVSHGNGPAGK